MEWEDFSYCSLRSKPHRSSIGIHSKDRYGKLSSTMNQKENLPPIFLKPMQSTQLIPLTHSHIISVMYSCHV